MRATVVRMNKEARALFWPWCAVMTGGMLPAVLSNSYTRKLNLLSLFVGVPLLAALALGNEFQQRTLTLWLVQPVSRMRLWTEKMAITFVAALSAAMVCGAVTFAYIWPHLGSTYEAAAVVCVIAVMASTPFWTLATRSSTGGFVLIGIHLAAAFWMARQVAELDSESGVLESHLPTWGFTAIVLGGIGYALLMLWLGGRKLVGLQVTGGNEDADLLMTGPELAPRFAAWFRSRPAGASLNLLRKEFRLLKPFWLFTAIFVVSFVVMLALRLIAAFPIPIPNEDPKSWHDMLGWVVFCILGSSSLLIPIFAGILSLGEERTSGTQARHLSLPISPLRQWAMKLGVALGSGFLAAGVLPLLAAMALGWIEGSPLKYVIVRELYDWMRLVPIMTLAGFWCACAATSTVRASLWVAVAPMMVFLAAPLGTTAGARLAQSRGTVADVVISRWHLNPLTLSSFNSVARGEVLWLYVPALLVALFQSYRLFRRQPEEGLRWMLQCLGPLLVVTMLCTVGASAGFTASRWAPFDETHRAIDSLQRGPASLKISGVELAKRPAISTLTREWLNDATIVVASDPSQASDYIATIHLVGGRECRLRVNSYGGSAAFCHAP